MICRLEHALVANISDEMLEYAGMEVKP